jgi:death on curing protein
LPEKQYVHLGVEAALAIHTEVLAAHGGGTGLSSRALLESAIAAPQATFGGKALLADGIEMAAAYLFYLCSNHPFVDGNKRTGLAACLVFLQLNGLLLDPDLPGRDVDEWERLVLDVANSVLDRDATTARLRKLLQSARKGRTK